MTTTRTPVVYIHGLWPHASSRQSRLNRGHSLTIDSGWRAVADECLSWPGKQGL